MTTAGLDGAARLALTLDAGSDWAVDVTVKDEGTPVDLTGYSAVMEVRSGNTDALLLARSTASGTIVLSPTEGTLTVTATAAETAAFAWRNAIYEIRLTAPGGAKSRLLVGTVSVQPGVIR